MSRHTPKQLDPERIAHLRNLSHLLDSKWVIPGTGVRFGVDGVASIVPGVGDTLTALVSAYIIMQAREIGVPKSTLLRMAGNVGLDWAVGSIPVLGTIFDVAFKANNRNMALLNKHLDQFEDQAAERLRTAQDTTPGYVHGPSADRPPGRPPKVTVVTPPNKVTGRRPQG